MKGKIKPIKGWVLVSRETEMTADGKNIDHGKYICWEGVFETKAKALGFAAQNNWPKQYWAVRGEMRVIP